MEALILLLPALGCGLMMVAFMYLMGRGMRSRHGPQPPQRNTESEVAELRSEVARLQAERPEAGQTGDQARG